MTAATSEAPAGGRVRPSVRLHDPVHPDRRRGDPDLDHPGRGIRPRPGWRADPRAPTTGSTANPQRIVVDSLMAPINGLYGIEAEDGSISVWNSGELFGAIDVALFILVIGGFLGVTMETGAIQGGIARIVGAARGP